MDNFIIIAIIAVIVILAALYVYKAKKNGRKCIGCPYAKNCKSGGCGCGCGGNESK